MAEPTVSIFRLAEQLGVSATTVSRVLNNRRGIGEETRRRVWEAARAAGYRPQQSVRRVTVGLLVDYVSDETAGGFVPRLTTRVMAELAKHELVVEVFSRGNLHTMGQRYVDGILAIAWEPESIAALDGIMGVPVVIFNRHEYPRFSCVRSDTSIGGRTVGELLVRAGHRRIAFLSDHRGDSILQAISGLREAVAQAGVTLDDALIAHTDYGSPIEHLERLLAQKPTALWACSDELSYQVPYLCRERLRLSVPADLSIVGTDNAAQHRFACPPLTVISEDVQGLVDRALATLTDQIAKRDTTPRSEMVPMRLIERESVRKLDG